MSILKRTASFSDKVGSASERERERERERIARFLTFSLGSVQCEFCSDAIQHGNAFERRGRKWGQ